LSVSTSRLEGLDQLAQSTLLDEHTSNRLRTLAKAVALICREHGCPCIANRLEAGQLFAPLHRQPAGQCAACGSDNSHLPVPLLAKLAPLTQALAKAGYYDVAMLSVELALVFEDSWDLRLARAYLCVVLGEMEEAQRIYRKVVGHLGQLPRAELDRLAQLSSSHADEEDIAELYQQLRRYSAYHA
jgi:hypothetical protein